MIKNIVGYFSPDMAIDLGTANTLVYVRRKGIVLNEPSVVAINANSRSDDTEVLAVGEAAKIMVGRTPESIKMIRPLKDGVIADFKTTEAMLKYFVKSVLGRSFMLAPRLVVCIPYGSTQVERRAINEAALSAGAREVNIIEEPMAAAIGAGLPVTEASGSMIIDIGGGTSEIAVISYGGIVVSKSVRVGGDEMDHDIVDYVRREKSLLIGTNTAERIKIDIGCAYGAAKNLSINIKGRNLVTGVPSSVDITQQDIQNALSSCVSEIITGVRTCLEKTPPELASDIVEKGIVLSGGGGQLSGLDEVVR